MFLAGLLFGNVSQAVRSQAVSFENVMKIDGKMLILSPPLSQVSWFRSSSIPTFGKI